MHANQDESESILRFEKDGTMAVLIRQKRGPRASWVAVAMPLPIADPGPRYHLEILDTGDLRTAPNRLMVIDAAGQRLLGVQVAQILAVAAWIAKRERSQRVHLVGDGWSCCFALLLAAAIRPRLFASFTNYSTLRTLRYVTDWPLKFAEAPACFCFGLLEVADVPQIKALLEGVEYRQTNRAILPERVMRRKKP